MGGILMIGYAVRKDGLGWRAVEDKSWCTESETFQIEQPPLPEAADNESEVKQAE